jgi:hypothetical protein
MNNTAEEVSMLSKDEINKTLEVYFDALYEGDLEKIRAVFHPASHLYSATDGNFVDMPLEDYVSLVSGRPSPKAQSAPRTGTAVLIDQSGPNSALAKVTLSIGNRTFTDYLTLLKIEDEWKIIAKAYHFTESE